MTKTLRATTPTSIFHRRRLDYDSIVELIPAGASVLDLGCGTGGSWRGCGGADTGRIMGIELDERAIVACVRRGLDVVQADLNQGLAAFADRQFDFVVLSQTLQAVLDVERVLDGHAPGRAGRGSSAFPTWPIGSCGSSLPKRAAPRGPGHLLGFQWYNTPERPLPFDRRFRRLLPREGDHDPSADRVGHDRQR